MVTTPSDQHETRPVRSGAPSIEHDASRWKLTAGSARDAAHERHAFRAYLERFGDSESDFDAAETVYGELVNTCVQHAPDAIEISFAWADSTLTVIDARDRLRMWPFSSDDTGAEATHHAFALINAFTGRVHVAREANGTRARVVLPVSKAASRV